MSETKKPIDIVKILAAIDQEKSKKQMLYDLETKRLLTGITDPLKIININFRDSPLIQEALDSLFSAAKINAKIIYNIAENEEAIKHKTSRKNHEDIFSFHSKVINESFVISLPISTSTRSLAKQALNLFEAMLRSKSAGHQIKINIESNDNALHLIVEIDDFFNAEYLRNLFCDFSDLCRGKKEATDLNIGNDIIYIKAEVMKLRNEVKEYKNASIKIYDNENGIIYIQQNCHIEKIITNESTPNTKIAEISSKIYELIKEIPDKNTRDEIERTSKEMMHAYGSSEFLPKYQAFIASSANHMTLLSPIIPILTDLIR